MSQNRGASLLQVPLGQYIEADFGVYIFARKYGKKYTPIYIRRAKNLLGRLKQQMANLKLINKVQNFNPKNNGDDRAVNGNRVLFVGYIKTSGPADKDKAIALVEKALIENALLDGFPIVNIHGTVIRHHVVYTEGTEAVKSFLPEHLLVRQG